MRNVVLLCLDTVRKDFFDLYAPRVRSLADRSFSRCRAASAWSVPSHASMVTGRLPSEHGVHTHNRDFDGVDASDTFLDDLADHRTIGVSANVFAGSAFGFDDCFDEFADVSDGRRYPDGMDLVAFLSDVDDERLETYASFLRSALAHDYPLQTLANGATAFLEDVSADRNLPTLFDDGATAVLRECRARIATTEEPFFAFANVMDAHTPLQHTRGYDRSLHDAPDDFSTDEATVWDLMGSVDAYREYSRYRRGLYGASIDYLDRQVAAFVDWLRRRTDRETTVVVTSDHGENLGYPMEDRMVRHKSSLSEGLLHVPLEVVDAPPDLPETDRYVSHLSLGDLLVAAASDRAGELDLGSARAPAEVIGMSAGPEPPADREFWDRMIRAVCDEDAKYVWDSLGNRQEYAVRADRPCWQSLESEGEGVSIPAWARDAFETDVCEYKRESADEEHAAETTEAVERRLADLGYV